MEIFIEPFPFFAPVFLPIIGVLVGLIVLFGILWGKSSRRYTSVFEVITIALILAGPLLICTIFAFVSSGWDLSHRKEAFAEQGLTYIDTLETDSTVTLIAREDGTLQRVTLIQSPQGSGWHYVVEVP